MTSRLRATAFVLLAVALCVFASSALALGAEPSALPTLEPRALLDSGDPRSEGAGPGLVGDPLLIAAGVVLLGLATALVTVTAVRLSERG